jgi:hypothetical protein
VRLFRHTRGNSRRAQKRTGRWVSFAPETDFISLHMIYQWVAPEPATPNEIGSFGRIGRFIARRTTVRV